VTSLDGGVYNFQMDEWNSSTQECVSINGLGFNITQAKFTNATNSSPGGYASIYRGCHWGNCTASNPFPIQESKIGSATSSVSISQPGGSQNDVAYDIWFNQSSSTSGQPNGTEIMIWINHQGAPEPFGTNTGTTNINGANYQVWTGRESSWNIVSYVATNPVTSVNNLNLVPFFSDAVSRGSLQSSWYLIDVEFGFEIWTGGSGLSMSNFSVNASAGGSTPPPSGNLIANGTYTIKSRSSGLLLEDLNASMSNGQRMDQWPANGCNCQNWTLTNLGNNYVYLINQRSGLALEVYNNSTSNGGWIDQWPYWGGGTQIWQVVSMGNGYYELINKNSGMALDVPYFSTQGGTLLDQWSVNGGNNQQWSF
jgi:hypothetical protein